LKDSAAEDISPEHIDMLGKITSYGKGKKDELREKLARL
jgi:hypothetical protein